MASSTVKDCPMAQLQNVGGLDHNNPAPGDRDIEMANPTAGTQDDNSIQHSMTVHGMIEQVAANDKSVQFNPYTEQVRQPNTADSKKQ